MKKAIALVALFVAMMVFTLTVYADSSVIKVNAELGTVSVNYNATDYSKYKVLITNDGERYVYNIFDNQEEFALQMGNGQYTIGIYELISGNRYRKVTSKSSFVTVNEMTVYTASVQNINWNANSSAAVLAKELTKNAKTDQEKFDAIYDYMINNIVYDYAKAATVTSRYLPSNDQTIASGKGICYDYSSLMASMLRSVGVPTKLVEGQSSYTSVYHAWNEVFINGEWISVDTTIDAQLSKRNIAYDVAKSDKDYSVVKSF